MLNVAQQIREALDPVRAAWSGAPRVGIILGSGLGSVGEQIEIEASIDYDRMPHFSRTTAVGHKGRLVCGRLDNTPVVAMDGRCHLYEGHSAQNATLPARLLKALGIEILILSSAAGGVNPAFDVGDLVIIEDHLNLMFRNPLIGINDDALGPRFPDMSRACDPQLAELAHMAGRRANIAVQRGVYVGMLGPTYETRAEYRMIRRIGGDLVGMSTVPEVIVAAHAGLRVLGFAVVTNVFREGSREITDHTAVTKVAEAAAERMTTIIRGVLDLAL